MIKKLLFTITFLIATICSFSCSADLIAPKAGDTHPYVYLSDDFIDNLRDENGEIKSEYLASYNYIKNFATNALPAQPEGGYINSTISNQLVSRALMYALGEFDDAHAKATVEYTIEYLKNPKTSQTYSISMYKDYGTNGIECGALVYDWCYDVLTDTQKETLAKEIMAIYDIKEDTNGDGKIEIVQPCRPDNASSWSELAGYAVGQPLIYNTIAATALYDYNADTFYNVIMPKIQGNMAKVVKMYGSAGALSDGSMSYTREYYTYYIYVLFQRLGATEEQMLELYGDQTPLGYKMLYARLPYGAFIKQGDDFYQANYKMNTYTNGAENTNMGLLASIYGDEYLHYQYAKVNHGVKKYLQFLTLDNDVGYKLPDTLPLAFETKEPRSEILARTSWQDGIASPTVSAYLSMNERRSGDHDHGHVGEFQLYYKGPLSMPGGVYEGTDWGKYHWAGYYTKTSSANCMLIVDPSEEFTYYSRVLSNDGSQRYAKYPNNAIFGTLAEHQSEVTRWATTENTFIGPNKNTPAFSYIKGDLTKAYSESKLDNYKRGMVFMDTFNEEYPGVLIVYDHVVSKDKTFDKKWLLQAVSNPEISGNKVTITNTQDGANGKLVNTTLLPESVNIEIVGGIDKYFAGGVEYPAPVQSTASEVYRSGYRAEVSPVAENTVDIFLNAMYVTDANGNAAELPMIKEVTNEFVGVTTLDRQVYFSKSGNLVENSFTITVRDNANGGNMLVLLTDIANGKWKVSGGSTNLILESVEGDSCLTFSVSPGTYTVSPVSDSSVLTALNWEEAEKEKLGDFAVRFGSSFIYLPDETYYFDNTAYISVATAKELGAEILVNGNSVTISKYGNSSKINVGDDFYYYNGNKISISHKAINHNGTIYLPVCDLARAFAVSAEFLPDLKQLSLVNYELVDQTGLLKPESVEGFDEDYILYDGIRGDKASFSAENYPYTSMPVTYYFGNSPKQVTKILVPGITSTDYITVYASLDGKNYFKVKPTSAELYDKYCVQLNLDISARYLQFKFSKCSINEVAVYGTESEEKLRFFGENVTKFDLNSGFETFAYVKGGFSSAQLYAGNVKIYTFSENSSGFYHINLSTEKLALVSKGTTNLRIVAVYGGKTETIQREIEFVERDSKKFINETFNETYIGNIFKSKSGYYFARNKSNVTESLENGTYKFIFDKQVTLSAPFIFANGFAKGNGVYEIYLDAELSSKNVNLGVELRDKNGKYPTSGPSYPLVSNMSGKLSFKIIVDFDNNIYQAFVKEMGSSEDYAVFAETSFVSDGLDQIRFTATNKEGSGYVAFDNFTATYHSNIGGSVSADDEDVLDDTISLSAHSENADKVVFCVDDKPVTTFDKSADGNYEFETSFEDSGIKTFDVYLKQGNEYTVESKTFNYNPILKRNIKTYAGPYTTALKSDGSCWVNATSTSAYFAGRVVFEGDITLTSSTDMVYFELGGASDYNFTWGGTNYITLHDALGFGTETPLFGANGKILDTDISYTLNTPMNIKYVCDTVTDTYEFYVNGNLVATKKGTADYFGKQNLVSAKIVGCMVRLLHVDSDNDGKGCATFENVKTYQEISAPAIESISSSGKDLLTSGGYAISKNIKDFEVKFSAPFENIDNSLVSITQNGEEISFDADYNSALNTLIISNADFKMGKAVLTISPDAKCEVLDAVNGESYDKTGRNITATIYVGNENGIYLSPVCYDENVAYCKYVTASNDAQSYYLSFAQYSENSLSKFAINSTLIKPYAFGLFKTQLQNFDSSEEIYIRLWNDKLEPIFSEKR